MADDLGGAPPRPARRGAAIAMVIAIGTAVALTLGTGLAWTAGHDSAPASGPAGAQRVDGPASPDTAAVEAVLAGRARAVRNRDRAAFAATVVSAPPAFQEAQRRLFDNLGRLPLESWQERLDSPIPVASGRGTATLRLTLGYRLRGFDSGIVARARYLTFAERGGSWVIVGDGSDRGLTGDAEIWDGGPVRVVRGRSSLVIGNSVTSVGPDLRELADRLDSAVPAVSAVLGTGWARKVVALVPADARQAGALVGQGQELTDIAALAVVTGQGAGGGADRVVISPGTFGRLNALGRRVVLTHELTHVATGGARDARTPVWLIEGLADYVGYRGERVAVHSAARELRAEVRAGRTPARLPVPGDFSGGSGTAPQAYEQSWLACRMIAERYGESALLRLYREAGRRSQDAALRAVLGMGTGEFTASWRTYLHKELS